ncbi:TIGR00730 family Rossman fold protein [Chondromyces apiculatus]|uniref:Cytokinin riboside 5'-monophosphate phosphoribohydrolase n=1 Tax=Chondromyces apiculatus DSM 436 TaxID=1192034 RepID=A0A017TII0_9BACT|nr:TIGR00730 family Rossman fold protein [Chondromyces apiculatus]EYF08655.1 Lysine decarboxylase family [Chondromyces apiculatus DSM 436]
MTAPQETVSQPRRFRRLCVYCGSSAGVRPEYAEAARALGAFLARRGIGLVYGGGRVGLMGAVADGALAAGGEVLGVIPDKLRARELAHLGLTELYVVDSMHARKTMMANLSDGFIAMPGGWGTLEETFEVTTWAQLNYHLKPVGLLNVGGYYDKLLDFVEHAVNEGFIRQPHRGLVVASADADELLDLMAKVEVPELGRWIENP